MNVYTIKLRHIFISPGHNYFGRPKDGPGTHPTLDGNEALVCSEVVLDNRATTTPLPRPKLPG